MSTIHMIGCDGCGASVEELPPTWLEIKGAVCDSELDDREALRGSRLLSNLPVRHACCAECLATLAASLVTVEDAWGPDTGRSREDEEEEFVDE